MVLGVLVVWPIAFTVFRSLYNRSGDAFIGVGNYRTMFRAGSTRTAIRNNVVWVVFAPSIVTALGLIYAVLTERVRWSTAFRFVVFMPMAISLLAAGVIFRLAYEGDPGRGLANALARAAVDVVHRPGPYPGARPADDAVLGPDNGGFVSKVDFSPRQPALVGLVGLRPALVSKSATAATVSGDGVVWFDFSASGGERGRLDPGEKGLPGVRVEAIVDGRAVAGATTRQDGSFAFDHPPSSPYRLRLSPSTFRSGFGGVGWLAPSLVTPSIIAAYVWIWAGFAMMVIAAGLATIPRELLEAARVDGANEWQVFRRVTVPLLSPVLIVVLVTLVINVLKIFDLILVVPPGSVQDDANVVAVEMWNASFGGGRDQGLGSALAVLLFLLVLPAMVFQLRRMRSS